MKTLQDYIVDDRLYASDTGPEAVVGDQVKLFLDQEANPAFPEFILGIIQHPIVRVNCESSTSYVIEYDEADLLGSASLIRPGDVIDAIVITQLDNVLAVIDSQFQTTTFSNSTGNTTITVPEGCINYTVYGTFTGTASTRNIVLDLTNATAGCRLALNLDLPATDSIILSFRNATAGGTELDTLTTDISGDDAFIEFGFTTAWKKNHSQYPI